MSLSVYVDPLFETPISEKWPFSSACHMMADDVDELYKMAATLKLKARWIQVTSVVHFDLTKNKRWHALKRGAIEVDDRFRPENYKEQVEEFRSGRRRI